MDYKRVVTIQDISCLGQCSLTVALPIISACGVETCIIPSAVLSTHSGGTFKDFTFRDLTEDIPGIAAHWKQQGFTFDAVYTGYLGSAAQIGYVRDIIKELGKTDCITVVDPAMADNGKLYSNFDDTFVEAIRPLCFQADYILPNITEACLLTGTEYREAYDEAYIETLLSRMVDNGAKTIILTGVSLRPQTTGVLIYKAGEKHYYEHRRIDRICHGTGDVYASAFVGSLLRGKSDFEAAKIAADFVIRCIENTMDDPEHWYGVKFETALPDLIRMLEGTGKQSFQ